MDSGEIEVISLRREPSHAQRPRPQRMVRRRLLITCGCALALALAVVGLLLSTQADPHTALATLLGIPSPTPTAPLALGASVFLVEHRVPWGMLTVDGKRNDVLDITQLPDGDPLNNPVSFLLARGRHQIVYNAAPFTPLRCVVTVPAAARDTCPLAQPDDQTRTQVIGAARILDLGATLDRLPAQPMADLVAAATAAIGVSTPAVVASAGDHYLGSDLQTHTFTQDTRVSIFREAWQGAPVAGLTACQFLCPGTAGYATPPSAWPLTAEVREGYHYAPIAGGAPALADGPLAWTSESFKQPLGPLADSAPFDVTWDGTWHVTLEPLSGQAGQSLVCQAATTVMSNYATGSGPRDAVPQFQWVPAANQADGCAVGIQLFKPDGTKGATGTLLYRFGALLTTDATSRALFPDLPAADGAEQALAQQILAHAA